MDTEETLHISKHVEYYCNWHKQWHKAYVRCRGNRFYNNNVKPFVDVYRFYKRIFSWVVTKIKD